MRPSKREKGLVLTMMKRTRINKKPRGLKYILFVGFIAGIVMAPNPGTVAGIKNVVVTNHSGHTGTTDSSAKAKPKKKKKLSKHQVLKF
jgi:hypothetical protein